MLHQWFGLLCIPSNDNYGRCIDMDQWMDSSWNDRHRQSEFFPLISGWAILPHITINRSLSGCINGWGSTSIHYKIDVWIRCLWHGVIISWLRLCWLWIKLSPLLANCDRNKNEGNRYFHCFTLFWREKALALFITSQLKVTKIHENIYWWEYWAHFWHTSLSLGEP